MYVAIVPVGESNGTITVDFRLLLFCEEILMARSIIEIGNAPCAACGSRLEVEVHSAYSTQVECAMCRYRRGELTPSQVDNLGIVAAECGERVPPEE